MMNVLITFYKIISRNDQVGRAGSVEPYFRLWALGIKLKILSFTTKHVLSVGVIPKNSVSISLMGHVGA